MYSNYFLLAIVILFSSCFSSKTTDKDFQVISYIHNSDEIPRLGKYEATFNLDKSWDNPYDNVNEVEVNAYFALPNGIIEKIPGFWYEGFGRNLIGKDEHLTSNGNNSWMIRYSPKLLGDYKCYIEIIDRTKSNKIIRYPSNGFLIFTSNNSLEKGFLKVSESDWAYLDYEDNTPYIGLGHNLVGWEWNGTTNSRGTYDYDDWLGKMAANGANMAQFDFCETDQLEWTFHKDELPFSNAWKGIGKYNQQNSWKMDYRFEKAEQLGVFFRLSLLHWEDFDKETESYPHYGWNRNPYNLINGGPVANVSDFFTDNSAKDYFKQYARYVVARWGYSKNILTYELWNEADGHDILWGEGNSFKSNQKNITAWHSEMSNYLKQLDPNHLVTTSFANTDYGADIWKLPTIDLTTAHRYTFYNQWLPGNFPQFETENFIGYLIESRKKYNKPTIIGEQALSAVGEAQMENDQNGDLGFHNMLWASIMQKALGTSMHWYWGKYIDHFDLYYHYKPLSIFLKDEDLRNLTVHKTENGIVRSYGLKNNNKAYVWVQDINHTYINRELPINTIKGQILNFPLDDGKYTVELLNTFTGVIITTKTIICKSGKLEIQIPDFKKDIAIKIKKTLN